MKINRNIYPYNPDPERFPIYLTGIGGSEYQGYVNRPEGYQWHQILYSAQGEGFLEYDGKVVQLSAGDYFFLPADYASTYYGKESKWDVRWVTFTGYALDKILEKFEMTAPVVLHSPENTVLERIFEKMVNSQLNERMISDYVCSGLIYEYLIEFHMIRHAESMKLQNQKYNLLLPALSYIESNLCLDISIEELAALTGISHQHLCRIFKETMGARPVEYIMRRRMEKARELLRNESLPVSDIAASLGFSSPGYFSTTFRQYEGVSPMEYRKNVC